MMKNKGIKHFGIRLAPKILAVAILDYDKQIWIARIGIASVYGCNEVKTISLKGEKLLQHIAEAIFRKQAWILKEYGFEYKEK